MVNGKLGTVLLIGAMIFMPLEKLLVSNLGPGDVFIILFIVTSWVQIYRQRLRFHFPLAFPMWVIWTGSLIGTLSGLDIPTALIAITQEIYLFVFFLTLSNAITDREGLERFIKIWAIVAAVEGAIIVLDRMGIHIPVIGGFGAKAAATGASGAAAGGRAVGTFVNSNAAGGYMMITMFVLLSLPFPRNRLLRLGIFLDYIAAILATGSVGASIGMTVGLIVWVLYWLYRQGRSLVFISGAVMLLAIIVILMSPMLLSIISSGGQNSITYEINLIAHKMDKRLNLWSTDMTLLSEHPLGIGPNVTASLVTIGAHSDYVAFLTERGVIGFAGFFMMLGQVLFWAFLAARDSRNLREHLATGALTGALLGACAMALVHETNHGRPVWMMYAVIFLNYKLIWVEIKDKVVAARTRRRGLIAGPIEGLAD